MIWGDPGGSEQEMAFVASGEAYENTQFATRENVCGGGEAVLFKKSLGVPILFVKVCSKEEARERKG